MAYLAFDSSYAPCGFLIVPDGVEIYSAIAVLIQSDWDFPGVAMRCGWLLKDVQPDNWTVACDHDATDGTIDCKVCGCRANDFIGAAYDWLRDHDGESFAELDEYLQTESA
jgi:hypothetical protein